jgi:hypothetical protein
MKKNTEKGKYLDKNVIFAKKITKKSEKNHCVINVEKLGLKLW